jgi:DNA-binding NtrC family response regulator
VRPIVFVEDDVPEWRELTDALAGKGLPVVTAHGKAATLAAIGEHHPEVVLVGDWRMVKQLRKHDKATPIIVCNTHVPSSALLSLVKTYIQK